MKPAGYLTSTLEMLEREDSPAPDEIGSTWAKWLRPDGGLVIFRAATTGSFGSLDVYWAEADGRPNRLFAPVYYDHVRRLARDLARLVAVADEIPSRELLTSLGKRDVVPTCVGCSRSWGTIEAGHGHADVCPTMGPPPRWAYVS